MKKLHLIALVLAAAGILRAGDGTGPLPRSTPEAQGVSSAAVLEFVHLGPNRGDAWSGHCEARTGDRRRVVETV